MMYKVEYEYEDDKKPHNRFYSALDANTAKAMFEETCEDGSLSGCNVKIVNVCKIRPKAEKPAEVSNYKH